MLLLEEKIQKMEQKNLGEMVFAAEVGVIRMMMMRRKRMMRRRRKRKEIKLRLLNSTPRKEKSSVPLMLLTVQ